jgi:hypothetical protein
MVWANCVIHCSLRNWTKSSSEKPFIVEENTFENELTRNEEALNTIPVSGPSDFQFVRIGS